jgi:predicted GIY-YIG superfamily endonuclease
VISIILVSIPEKALADASGLAFKSTGWRSVVLTVYLLHFERPVYGTSRHYIGFTTNLEQRLAMHRSGHGARITSIAAKKGIAWELAYVWEDGDKELERYLKKGGRGRKYCAICSPQARVTAEADRRAGHDVADQRHEPDEP